jgi:nicotinamidase/pyrazinamidase
MAKSMIVIDCQFDFIYGSLACQRAEDAVRRIVRYINSNEVEPFYSMDWHSPENKSFKENGGIWPVHCVQDEQGSTLHEDFDRSVALPWQRPNEGNVFKKGIDDHVEEYSAYYAKREDGKVISDLLTKSVIVAGIATEFCVRETVMELLKNGHEVELIKDGLGYVDEDNHFKTLEELKNLGVVLI